MRHRTLSFSGWLALLVTAALVPLLVFAAVTLVWIADSHQDVDAGHLRETTRALALAIDREVRSWKAALTALAGSRDLEQGRYADFYEEALRVAALHDGWVVLTQPNGQQVLNTLRPYGAPLPVGNPVLQAALDDRKPVVLDPYSGAVAGRLIVSVAMPVLRNDRPAHVLDLSFDGERLSRLLRQQRLPGSWAAGINDRQHRVAARSHDTQQPVGAPARGVRVDAVAEDQSGLFRGALQDGQAVWTAFQRLGEVPWMLILAVPASEMERVTPLVTFIIAAGVLVLAALGAAVYLGRRIAAPVVALAANSRQALQEPLPPHHPSEIREVAQLQEALVEAAAGAQAHYREREALVVALETARATEASREELRRANERVAGILESITDGFFAVDPEWRFTYVNATGAALLGMPRDALVGKVIWDLFPVALGTRFSTESQRAMEVQTPVHFDEFYPEPLNAWFECHCYPSREGLSVFFRNITERRRTEDTLAAQRHLLQMLFESTTEGITVRDAQGRVAFVNAVARRRALLPPDGTPLDMAPQVWGEYRDANGKPVPIEEWPISRALRGEPATAEMERVTPTGSRFIRNSAAPLRNDRGEIIGLVAITMDLTDRKRMEDQLRQALRSEEAARADNLALLREVHHRTKNNLQMLCDLVYLQMEALQDADKQAVLQDTYGRIYAIARLHEQLYLSMQSGQVRLDHYFMRLLDGCKDLYPAVPVRLEATGEPLYLDLDRAIHAGLILNELVTNAAKHAFPDGRRGAIVVRLRASGERLEFSVHDNGVGLPPTLDVPHAKSLGLRIIHILARRLQASITAENADGAAFTIAFPLTPQD